ncbi:diheme cytochrome c [Hydrogenophaga sp. IBVHS2]|uniref:diheme cytochrome c n=1 Tax=Hydrogenophaga sp. IBVHS2 TaxID=1985170 RepID=UPI000A2D5B89|nr:diheme cytochrome c [Hydrogenophaga sp. IBVHS2]OSZ68073.1 cytochrome C [Hydrogenophaga sp. IBVHS2]
MTLSLPITRRWFAALALPLGLLCLGTAHADDRRDMPRQVPKAYRQECAACHVAYPPGMLPARSWQRVMTGLDRHYGTDASLDAATVARLGDWLQTHAATGRHAAEAPADDRITRTAWFERQHRGIEPAVWKLPSVRSAAQCAACHTGAEQGRFDDDNLRMPAGLTARQQRAWND